MKKRFTLPKMTIRLVILSSLLLLFLATHAQAPQYTLVHASSVLNAVPLASTANQREWIFYPSDFPGAPSGMITTIYIKVSAAVSPNFTNFAVMAGPTTLNTFTAGPWITSGLSTVLYSPSWSGSTIAGNWLPIQLQTPFNYDNSSNFIILISQGGYSPGASIMQGTVTARSLMGSSTSANGFLQDRLVDFGFDIVPPGSTEDAGITTITHPTTLASPGFENITVVLKNYGTDTLTSALINWSVNDIAQTSFPWTGSLLPTGDTTSVTIGSYNFPNGVFTIKAWSSMPNGVADTLNYNDTTTKTVIVCNLLSGTFTVGGATADYPTLQTAINAAEACGISGPVTFNILPGTYTEQVTIPSIPGTSATNRVTFQSSTNNPADVIIANAASSTGNFTVRLDAADYIELLNLTIQANHTTNARVIELIGGADYNLISGCVIYSNPLARASSTSAGIYSGASLDHGNIIAGNLIQNGYYSIYMYGTSSSVLEQGTIIEDNTMEDFFYAGAYLYCQQSPKLIGNTIQNHTTSATVYGVYSNYCQQELDFRKNRLNMTGSSTVYGMYLHYNTALSDLAPGLVSNNFITASGTGASIYPLYLSYSNYHYLYHNSVMIVGGSNTSRSVWYNYGANNRSINNIFYNNGPGYAAYYSGSPLTVSDYNDFFSTASNLAYYGTTNAYTLAALQLASGMEINSVNIFPQFAGSTLLIPGSISLNNLGTPLALILDDINGNLRDPLTPDMGAVEFTPAHNDVGISVVNEPGAVAGPGSNNISATIKNFGLSNLNLATLYFSVNGSAPVSYLWSGILSPGNEAGPILIGSHIFTYGIHQVKVWAGNPNGQTDLNSWNDTLVKTVYICDMFNGTYTIGPTGSGADFNSFAAALTDLNSCGVAGPSIFNVLPGTYNEQVTIGVLPGASGLNPVTFQSSTGMASDVVVQYSSLGASDNWVIRLDGADYITLQNMTIKTTSQTGTYGTVIELINGADFNTLRGNIIVSMPESSSLLTAGIYSGETKDEYNVIASNTITGGYYGICLYGPYTSRETGNLVVGNTIQGFYFYGIYAGYQDSPLISENIIVSRANNSTQAHGVYAYYNNNASIVTKNRINVRATSANYALHMYYCNGTTTDRGLVANNFISQSLTTGPTAIYGLYNYYTTYFDFYHNSVNILANYSTGCAWNHTGLATANCKYINNMFVNMGGGYAAYIPTSALAGITAMDYNNYYSPGTNLAFLGSLQTTLAGIQSVTQMNYNSISANPLYYFPTSLYPSSVAVNNLGVPIAIVQDDIDGNIRSSITPDMGAVEFEPPQYDAGISAINSPGSPISPGSHMISATIKNYGLVDLLTANVHWNINGGSVNSQPWTGLVSPSQESAPLNLGSYIFPNGQHVLKVWTSGPNSSNDYNAFNDTMTKVINVCDILMGTFTIGGTGSDYSSITAAVAAMNNCGIGGPVTFNVQPGIYNEQITIEEIPGASATNTVTFQSSTGLPSDVTLTFVPTSAANWVVRLDGADYITLKDMTLKIATGTTTWGRVIELTNGANYNTIHGNVIESMAGSTSSATACIYSGSSIDEYNVFSNNTMRHGYYALYLYGSGVDSTENGNIVLNNTIEGYYYYGVYLYYQSNVAVSGNTINNASNSTTAYALRPYYCYDGTILTRNRITMTGTYANYGIYAYSATGTATEPGLIANNIINQTAANTSTVYMLYFYNTAYMRVYHNTLRAKGTSTTNYGVYVMSGNTNMEFVNNMVVNQGSGCTMYGTVANLQAMSVCNFNNYYATGPNLAYAGAAVSNLAAWKIATGLDANSVSADPGFISSTNLTPGLAAVNNLGTPIAVIPNDINGVLRNILTPDMGAIEFDPIPYEAAHLGFNQPIGGCDAGIEPVTILIRNRGSMNINGGLTASYKILGSSTIYTDTIYSTIPTGDTLVYSFLSQVDLTSTVDSVFNIVSWIKLTGDPIPDNDTATQAVNSLVSPAAPQVVNVNIPFGQSATLAVINPDTSNLYYWYNVPIGGTYLAIDSTYTTPLLSNTTVYYVEATAGIASGSLQTIMTAGNSMGGAMFNLTAISPLTIDSFYVHSLVSGTLEVYYKLGSYIGFEQDSSAWTLAGSTNIVGAGTGNNTLANIGGIKLNAGQTYGIYITLTSGSLQYTDGTSTNLYYADANLSLEAGVGIIYPFASIFTGRVWNGTIHYSSGNGCVSIRVSDTVFVLAPVVTVNVGPDISICQGDTTQFSAIVSGGVAPYSYIWSPTANLSNVTIANPMAFPQINTTYSVTVTDQNGDSGTDDIIVTVTPSPNVSFAALPVVKLHDPAFPLTGGLPAGGTYSGPGVSGGIFTPSVAGAGTHTLTYSYTDPISGCTGSATANQTVQNDIGLEEKTDRISFSIFPNPSTGLIVLTVRSQESEMRMEILDVQGKVILEKKLINVTGRHELDLGILPPGVYQVRLSSDTESYLQKLVLH